MKKSRFSELQISGIVKEYENGIPGKDLCRQHGININTLYKWKNKYSGMTGSDIKRLKQLEEENNKLKHMYADMSLENHALKDLIGKKVVKPSDRRAHVGYLIEEHQLSIRQACVILSVSRSLFYYKMKSSSDETIVSILNEFAERHPSYGFWKMYKMMKQKGVKWNHKKVYRIYTNLKLNIRRKAKRRLPERVKEPLTVPLKANQIWSIDFMSDSLYNNRKFRVLNIIDDFNREALTMVSDISITATRLVRELEILKEMHGKPERIRTDNGPEFISKTLADWCNKNNVEHLFTQPGKPTQNAYVERFNGSFRREILNAYIFTNLAQVKFMTEEWKEHYNTARPHHSLGDLTPKQFLLKNENDSIKW
ncbi:MAG: IS3 family transposase [Rhabdochlamydiaceae bacterium]